MLTGVAFASRYKVARALTTKEASEVPFVLEAILKLLLKHLQKIQELQDSEKVLAISFQIRTAL